jgi:hypothetical protein
LAGGVVAALTMTLAPAPTASADTPRCVTRGEFDRVQHGMRKARVHRIFDTRGFFLDGGAGGYAGAYWRCKNPVGAANLYWAATIEYRVIAAGVHRVASKRWWGWSTD